jgi:hypothetical protein
VSQPACLGTRSIVLDAQVLVEEHDASFKGAQCHDVALDLE